MTVTTVVFFTVPVTMEIEALLLPAGTVIFVGTLTTAALELARLTLAPPTGAGPVRDTVSTVGLPCVTLDGLKASPSSWAGLTVRIPVLVTPLSSPEIVATWVAATEEVVTTNVALVAPAATLTPAGVLAAALLLESRTVTPPSAAAPEIVTFP